MLEENIGSLETILINYYRKLEGNPCFVKKKKKAGGQSAMQYTCTGAF